MIVLDTHIWLWWMSKSPQMKPEWNQAITTSERIGVSAISLFEVSWLVQRKRIELGCALDWWFEQALDGSNKRILTAENLDDLLSVGAQSLRDSETLSLAERASTKYYK